MSEPREVDVTASKFESLYTFEPRFPDGSPRRFAGMHRLPYDEAFGIASHHTDTQPGFMSAYLIPQWNDNWLKGLYDRPLYHIDGVEPLPAGLDAA